MNRQLAAFGDAEVVLVTFTSTPELERYVRWTGIEMVTLIDPDRSTYRAYGLGSAGFWQIWGLTNPKRSADPCRTQTHGDQTTHGGHSSTRRRL